MDNFTSNQSFIPGTSANLKVNVELTISAKNLLDKDILSKSDPICVIFYQPNRKDWVEFSRTEVIHNSLNPEFATKFIIEYRFEEVQKLKFQLYDIDGNSLCLDDHELLGEVECTLGQIISSSDFTFPLHSESDRNTGQLVILSEEIGNVKEEVELLFRGEDFKKSGFLSKPDPFLAIYKENSTQSQLVYRSSHIDDTCKPQWPVFTLPMRVLMWNNEPDCKLLIQCWNYNQNGSHKLIGEVRATTQEILKGPQTFSLTNKDKVNGKLILEKSTVNKTYSFLDFVNNSGTQLNCTFAIDFTASNGVPTSSTSLHFISSVPTFYEQALQSVGYVIQDYDSDKQFPVLGFGAKIPPHGQVSHEFFVNLSPNPFCAGVEGVIQAYRRCLPAIQLFGPTNFAPVINHVAQFAASHTNGDNYFILLILTDGEMTDMAQTKQAIIAASRLPMSIIIVGVGDAGFNSMNELDSDNGLLSHNQQIAVRDIVQFVPFSNFLNNPHKSLADLANALLAELPNQLVSYMKSNNIKPKNG